MTRTIFVSNDHRRIAILSTLRRMVPLTLLFMLWCLNGCLGDDHHDFHKPGKIPINAKRWYQLNNTSHGLDQLFNNNQYEKPNTGYGLLLDNYDAYYPLLEGEQMTIDSIMMFDWEGTNENHPMTVYAITQNWQRIPLAVFTGLRYNTWNGPDPKHPDVFTLPKPVSGIRYLVINSWGDFPGEVEFYGTYTPPALSAATAIDTIPLKNYFGVNAFEWDFENPQNATQLDPVRLSAISHFSAVRHYMNWDKLEFKKDMYTFSPVTSGGWNYDTIYQWCHANNIEVLACLKTIPDWLQASYPADKRDDENIPMKYGSDPSSPLSYIEQAKVGFRFAARYGTNKNIDPGLLLLDPDNIPRIGLGTVHYIECDNERDKWWKGRKAYQTGREYAANMSAFYDGNKNTMGPGVGVKNADHLMQVVMAGLAMPDPGYVQGMIDWCKEFRGIKPDGSVDLPWDVINYHYYCNDEDYSPGKKQTTGLAPEMTNAAKVAADFTRLAHLYAHNMPVWVTETGYDINPGSPQKAGPAKGRTILQTQADWSLRTSLAFARAGIQRIFFYELMDDNSASDGRFATSGLINNDRSPRPAADYCSQVIKLFGEYSFAETISISPIVDRYTYHGHSMFMLVQPTASGITKTYNLNIAPASEVYIYRPKAGSDHMEQEIRKTVNGKIDILVSETPLFITSSGQGSNMPAKKTNN